MKQDQLKKIKVLLVDDDVKIIKAARFSLTSFTLFTATNIKEAMDIYNSEKIDIVVSDYNMANGSGLDLKNQIDGATSQVPFIVVSGQVTKDMSMKFANIHVYHIFEKPLMFEELEKKIVEAHISYTHEIMKDKFASIGKNSGQILHDINNSLAIISLSSELGSQNTDNEFIQSQFTRNIDATKKIDKLIKKYKSFMSNNTKLDIKPVNAKTFLSKICNNMAPIYQKDRVRLIFDDQLEMHSIILADEVILSPVFENLLKNSFDAVKGSENAWITMQAVIKDNKLQIKIIDSGNGINDAIISKMFTTGFTTKGAEGTGMGLSYCNEMIEMHFGDFRYIKNAPNTTFCVELPLNFY